MKDAIRRGCGKTGHIQKVCRSKPGAKYKSKLAERKPVHHLKESGEESSSDSASEDYALYSITCTSSSKQKTYRVDITINKKSTEMEIDTRASLTLVSECTLCDSWPYLKLSPSRITLHSYSGESIPVLGTVDVIVEYSGQTATLPLLVVKGEGPSLLGRNWLGALKLRQL